MLCLPFGVISVSVGSVSQCLPSYINFPLSPTVGITPVLIIDMDGTTVRLCVCLSVHLPRHFNLACNFRPILGTVFLFDRHFPSLNHQHWPPCDLDLWPFDLTVAMVLYKHIWLENETEDYIFRSFEIYKFS